MSEMNLTQRIEAIESGYEFMLAYAAQGYEAGQGGSHQHDILNHLEAMDTALEGLEAAITEVANSLDGDNIRHYESFVQTVERDGQKAQGAIRLVSSRPGISSQLVDNLNASIHLRALLTDLFLLDEAFSTKG